MYIAVIGMIFALNKRFFSICYADFVHSDFMQGQK